MASKEAIQKALRRFEEQLRDGELKLSLAEYVKLLQVEQDLEDEEPKEIRVQWVEPVRSSET